MRIEMVWDKWMLYDDNGFCCGIRPDAPDDVKRAYSQYVSEQEALKKSGCMPK